MSKYPMRSSPTTRTQKKERIQKIGRRTNEKWPRTELKLPKGERDETKYTSILIQLKLTWFN